MIKDRAIGHHLKVVRIADDLRTGKLFLHVLLVDHPTAHPLLSDLGGRGTCKNRSTKREGFNMCVVVHLIKLYHPMTF